VAVGAVLSLSAVLGSTALIALAHPGSTARIIIVAVALVVAILGGVMMLKDLTP
jgi:hypothetical protein